MEEEDALVLDAKYKEKGSFLPGANPKMLVSQDRASISDLHYNFVGRHNETQKQLLS